MIYEIYNGQDINGVNGEEFMARNTHLKGTIFLFKTESGNISQVESKDIIADVYGIDITLDNEAFIQAYETILKELEENAKEEIRKMYEV